MKISNTTNILVTITALIATVAITFVILYTIYCLLTMKGIMIHQ